MSGKLPWLLTENCSGEQADRILPQVEPFCKVVLARDSAIVYRCRLKF